MLQHPVTTGAHGQGLLLRPDPTVHAVTSTLVPAEMRPNVVTRAGLVKHYGVVVRVWIASLDRLFAQHGVTEQLVKAVFLMNCLPLAMRRVLHSELERTFYGGRYLYDYLVHRILTRFPEEDHGDILETDFHRLLYESRMDKRNGVCVHWRMDDFPELDMAWE